MTQHLKHSMIGHPKMKFKCYLFMVHSSLYLRVGKTSGAFKSLCSEQDGDVPFLRFLTFYKMIYRLKKNLHQVFFCFIIFAVFISEIVLQLLFWKVLSCVMTMCGERKWRVNWMDKVHYSCLACFIGYELRTDNKLATRIRHFVFRYRCSQRWLLLTCHSRLLSCLAPVRLLCCSAHGCRLKITY